MVAFVQYVFSRRGERIKWYGSMGRKSPLSWGSRVRHHSLPCDMEGFLDSSRAHVRACVREFVRACAEPPLRARAPARTSWAEEWEWFVSHILRAERVIQFEKFL